MVERFRPPAASDTAGGVYFAAPKSRDFIRSGCTVLDLVLGGGWAEGRVANIIGDKCLSGDAIVSVRRGTKPRKMTLAELFARVKGNHHNKDNSLDTHLLADVGGHVGMVKMLDVRMTGIKTLFKIEDEQGHVIKASEDHGFLTEAGWSTLANGLTVGTFVNTWSNTMTTQLTRVVSVARVGEEITYDVSMAGPHNFVADGFVVHNSTGKTLLCIEAAANFVEKYKKRGRIYYREVEAAFDVDYAQALGMPVSRVDFSHDMKHPVETVEDLFEDIEVVLTRVENAKEPYPILYIVDSLDALSDRAELKRTMDKGSYGTDKSKNMSELFRRLIQRMERANMTLIIVSQVRSKIGVTFGEKTTRSGGRALDFYGSQFIKLAHLGILHQTRVGQRRAIGVSIKAKSVKNKIGLPFRECEFDLLFGYGIDDLDASLRWLDEANGLRALDYHIVKLKKGEKRVNGTYGSLNEVIDDIWSWPDDEYQDELARVREAVEDRWWEIEKSHLPTRRKYK